MGALLAKLRRSRESSVTVEGRQFTITRPTAADAATMKGLNDVEVCQRFVVGWDLTELDIIPGGDASPVAFDKELFALWIVDQPKYWAGVAGAILDAFLTYREAGKEAEKN